MMLVRCLSIIPADNFIILGGILSGPVAFLGCRYLSSTFISSSFASGKLYILGLEHVFSNLINIWMVFIIANYSINQGNAICLILKITQCLWTGSLKKASFWRFCDILCMYYNIIQNWKMGTLLNPAIYMFVKVKYQTWIIL